MSTVFLAILAGQSNIEGRVTPDRVSTDLDVTNVWQFEGYSGRTSTYRTIQSDITPLWHRQGYTDVSAPQDRFGPGETICRQLIADNPTCKVLLVPTGQGSTPMVGGGTSWQAGNPGATLFENMISQASLANTAAASFFPGDTIVPLLFLAQGEQDAGNGTSRSTYYTALSDFVSFSRSRLNTAGVPGASTMKIVLCSMIPQLWAISSPSYNAAYAAINAAHVDASLNLSNVYYIKGSSADTGSSSDGLHYSPVAFTRTQGTRMAGALSDVTGPTVSSASSTGSIVGQKLSFVLTGSDAHQTFHINGGADAAQFENSDPYITPKLRWTGDGTGPAAGTYVVGIRARDGSGNYGTTQTFTATVAAEVSPVSFFTGGERGMVWDLSDLSLANMSQSIAGTGTVTVGSVVGFVRDLSPNANHWFAAADNTTRPTLQQDSDGKYYLSFDGSNDILFAATPFILTTNGKYTSSIGVFGAAPAAQKYLLGAYSTSTTTPFVEPWSALTTGTLTPSMRNDASGGPGTLPTIASMLDGATKRTVTSAYNGSSSTVRMRDRAARDPTTGLGGYSSVTQGAFANNFTVTRSALGGRGFSAPASWFAGRIYSGYVINRYATDTEVQNGEDWVAARTLAPVLTAITAVMPGQMAQFNSAAAAKVLVKASAAPALSPFTSSATAHVVTSSVITAVASMTMGAFQSTAAVKALVEGIGSATLNAFASTGSIRAKVKATAAPSLANFGVQAGARVKIKAAGAAQIDAFTLVGHASGPAPIHPAVTTPASRRVVGNLQSRRAAA